MPACNYIGRERIAEEIEKARQLRSLETVPPAPNTIPQCAAHLPTNYVIPGRQMRNEEAVVSSAGHRLTHIPMMTGAVAMPRQTVQEENMKKTLNTLKKSQPFRVRLSKCHSLIGRVVGFSHVGHALTMKLRVFIEYPIGSGTIFQSASGAATKMWFDYRESSGKRY